jgi:hypothetical protein
LSELATGEQKDENLDNSKQKQHLSPGTVISCREKMCAHTSLTVGFVIIVNPSLLQLSLKRRTRSRSRKKRGAGREERGREVSLHRREGGIKINAEHRRGRGGGDIIEMKGERGRENDIDKGKQEDEEECRGDEEECRGGRRRGGGGRSRYEDFSSRELSHSQSMTLMITLISLPSDTEESSDTEMIDSSDEERESESQGSPWSELS